MHIEPRCQGLILGVYKYFLLDRLKYHAMDPFQRHVMLLGNSWKRHVHYPDDLDLQTQMDYIQKEVRVLFYVRRTSGCLTKHVVRSSALHF